MTEGTHVAYSVISETALISHIGPTVQGRTAMAISEDTSNFWELIQDADGDWCLMHINIWGATPINVFIGGSPVPKTTNFVPPTVPFKPW